MRLSQSRIAETDTLTVTLKVKNSGKTADKEIVQLYVRDVEATVFRPEKELKGFTKVALQPGEEKEVKLELNGRSFAFYNPDLKDWQVESGAFEILVGASSRDIRLSQTVAVTAVYPPSHASPLNSCFQRTGAGYCASAVCARFLIMLEKMNP